MGTDFYDSGRRTQSNTIKVRNASVTAVIVLVCSAAAVHAHDSVPNSEVPAISSAPLASSPVASEPDLASERTISRTEILRYLRPIKFSHGEDNPGVRQYHWYYFVRDRKTGVLSQLFDGDPRRDEIDDDRMDCIPVVEKMDDENPGGPHYRVPVSQLQDRMDDWAKMVVGCVYKIHLLTSRYTDNLVPIMCIHDGPCPGMSAKTEAKLAEAHRAQP